MGTDNRVIKSFGNEWNRFDQSTVETDELNKIFMDYFEIFPWKLINKNSVGFDMGCGSGRWAKIIAPKVGKLNCIDPSSAIDVAKKNLKKNYNVNYIKTSIDKVTLKSNSQDFGYCLGVLHHLEDTQKNLNKCTSLLKKNSPFLIYLYYSFENKNFIYIFTWKLSNILRKFVSILPEKIKNIFSDLFALIFYFPMAKISYFLDKMKINVNNIPLSYYRNLSFYTMRTDSRDRFGTFVEKRYSKKQIKKMLKNAGLYNIKFSKKAPFWCAIGLKK